MHMKIVNKYYKKKQRKTSKRSLRKVPKSFWRRKRKKAKKAQDRHNIFSENKKKTKHKRNIKFTFNSKIEVLKNLLDMEMHWIQGFPALFLDNFQKILKKLVWKHLKFHTMTHYITSSTTCKIFTYQNTSWKYKEEFKQIYSSIIYLKRCKKSFKLQRKFIERMQIADEKPIQPFFHLNTSNTCQNSGNSLPKRWI